MMKSLFIPGFLAATFALSGCEAGMSKATGPESLIAIPQDVGFGRGTLIEGEAAVVYDPDGCQAWLVDDGVEGYSGRRFDPVTGLPICNNLFPPGSVIGDYETGSRDLVDRIP